MCVLACVCVCVCVCVCMCVCETCQRRTSEEELLQGGRLRGRGGMLMCGVGLRGVCVSAEMRPSITLQSMQACVDSAAEHQIRVGELRQQVRVALSCDTHTHTHTHTSVTHSSTDTHTHTHTHTDTRGSRWRMTRPCWGVRVR